MDDLISEFLTETNESLDELDLDLVNLEQNPNDKDLLGKIFRLMHTIKGTCGFLDLPRLEKVAHHAENVLGRFRDGDLEVTQDYVTLIFESIDRIKMIVASIEETGAEPDGDNAGLIERLDEVYEGRDSAQSGVNQSDAAGNAAAEPVDPLEAAFGTPVPASMTGQNEEFVNGTQEVDASAAVDGVDDGDGVAAHLQSVDAQVPEPSEAVAPVAAEKPKEAAQKAVAQKTDGAPAKSVSSQSLRVNVDVLENLMTMVSELVLTRNQLLQILRMQKENDFAAPLQRLNHVVSDLQEGVMKTRMQPIGNAWSKLPRIIRDLSLELGKKIDLEMHGQDTELDRQVLELIKDPLTHMVRNSGDHGIEDPATRLAVGKPETGKIQLRAYHEGGHIIIKIADDGKGLSTDKIKAKILENGLANASDLEDMSMKQIQQYIFKAGFSTAEKVTAVSGRGVGMDVVRTNIEKIGGSIELDSREGVGSTFTIKIPLTLAIVSALIVESGGERFAIPQLSVRELVMASSNGENRIETIKGAPVFRLRDHLLPLVSLSELLELGDGSDLEALVQDLPSPSAIDSSDGDVLADDPVDAELVENDVDSDAVEAVKERNNQYIVVTQVGVYSFGIIVNKVFDTEEIVVKPVSKILRDIELFSGNTILGDGSVIMILDPNGIARHTGEVETDSQVSAKEDIMDLAQAHQTTSLLLFSAGGLAPKAVPLSLVARLENVKISDVEYSSGSMLVQYRGSLMPLVKFNESVSLDGHEEKPVLVFSDRESSMGLIVDNIIDIMDAHVDIKVQGTHAGLMGSAIIDGKATDVVDVGHFLRTHNKDWFKNHDDTPFGQESVDASGDVKRVLLVDDSPFFRNMLTPLLSMAGYDVTTMESPIAALELCEQGADFDIIVSDIEMPDMDGFEFAERVKSNVKWQNTPMVALTSHATPQDIDRGMSVGFNKYIAKFDRDVLLKTLSQTLSEN